MQFETININELKPAEYNPRIMLPEQKEKLENNLKTFGLVDPIIIDLTDDNTVIGGHQRLEALKNINDEQKLHLLKLGDIGLVFKELDFKIKDKNDQKALNLSLNKIQGDWDYAKRDEILIELSEDNYNLELTGFGEELLELDNSVELEIDEEDMVNKNNIFEIYPEGKKGSLREYFLVPPFSVIDTTIGDFQERTEEWLKKTGNLSETRDTPETGTFGSGFMEQINKGTSNFNPFLVEILCKWYAPKNPCWLDPFGGEQTKGVVAGELGIPYHAVEIREEQVELNKEYTKKYPTVNYYCGDSAEIETIVPAINYNFCLTSPPYFDLELYSDGLTSNISYEDFMNQYEQIFLKVYELLQENSFLILKLSEVRNKKRGLLWISCR